MNETLTEIKRLREVVREQHKCIETLRDHIEQTETDFIYNGVTVPKSDVLKYIQTHLEN